MVHLCSHASKMYMRKLRIQHYGPFSKLQMRATFYLYAHIYDEPNSFEDECSTAFFYQLWNGIRVEVINPHCSYSAKIFKCQQQHQVHIQSRYFVIDTSSGDRVVLQKNQKECIEALSMQTRNHGVASSSHRYIIRTFRSATSYCVRWKPIRIKLPRYRFELAFLVKYIFKNYCELR